MIIQMSMDLGRIKGVEIIYTEESNDATTAEKKKHKFSAYNGCNYSPSPYAYNSTVHSCTTVCATLAGLSTPRSSKSTCTAALTTVRVGEYRSIRFVHVHYYDSSTVL